MHLLKNAEIDPSYMSYVEGKMQQIQTDMLHHKISVYDLTSKSAFAKRKHSNPGRKQKLRVLDKDQDDDDGLTRLEKRQIEKERLDHL